MLCRRSGCNDLKEDVNSHKADWKNIVEKFAKIEYNLFICWQNRLLNGLVGKTNYLKK